MIYWLLSIVTAVLAYAWGNLSTVSIASGLVFHKNLYKLGKGNTFISNFRRIYGWGGVAKLLAVEIIKDIIPILIGGWLFAFKGQATVGRALAGTCVVLGRLWPVLYGFKGSYAMGIVIIAAIMADFTTGLVVLVAFGILVWFTKNLPLAELASSLGLIVFTILVVDDSLVIKLMIIMALLTAMRSVRGAILVHQEKQPRLSFQTDLSYKFDEDYRH